VRRGFPWTAFEILEAPQSRLFIGLAKAGDKLTPTRRAEPLTWEETKTFGVLDGKYRVLDLDFTSLKRAINHR